MKYSGQHFNYLKQEKFFPYNNCMGWFNVLQQYFEKIKKGIKYKNLLFGLRHDLTLCCVVFSEFLKNRFYSLEFEYSCVFNCLNQH